MKRRRYWPWPAVLAGAFAALLIVLFFVGAIGEIALHRWRRVATLVVVFAVVSLTIGMVIRRFRDRFDYFIDADDNSLRHCSQKGSVTILRHDVLDIDWRPDSFVVRAKTGDLTITRIFMGYESLKRLIRSWKMDS